MSNNSKNIKNPSSGGKLFRVIENVFRVDSFFEEGVPIKYLPYVLYSTFIIIIYIGNNHYSERTIRQIDQLKVEVEDLRADFTTLKADYMYSSKQSEVSRNIANQGVEESSVPPFKIVIKEDEY
ncbi:MAG TPA: FtsL-like putative cell division protein [Cytophagales bacterium]|nr:FtsL-like putative cell division protein [Cytophagales bacterium]